VDRYILGAKDGIYDGTGLVKNSDNNVIYIAGNYRVCHSRTQVYDPILTNSSLVPSAFYPAQQSRKKVPQTLVSGTKEQSSNGSTTTPPSSAATPPTSQYGANRPAQA
jgi:hypothetical protein